MKNIRSFIDQISFCSNTLESAPYLLFGLIFLIFEKGNIIIKANIFYPKCILRRKNLPFVYQGDIVCYLINTIH